MSPAAMSNPDESVLPHCTAPQQGPELAATTAMQAY
jgi:hypothetical protein